MKITALATCEEMCDYLSKHYLEKYGTKISVSNDMKDRVKDLYSKQIQEAEIMLEEAIKGEKGKRYLLYFDGWKRTKMNEPGDFWHSDNNQIICFKGLDYKFYGNDKLRYRPHPQNLGEFITNCIEDKVVLEWDAYVIKGYFLEWVGQE